MVAHEKSAEIHIPRVKKTKHHVPWESEDIAEKIEALQVTTKARSGRNTRANKAHFEKTKQDLDAVYQNEMETFIHNKIDTINKASEKQQSRLAWNTVNEISGCKNTRRGRLKANSPEERILKWKEHFSNLLGKPPVIDEVEITRVVADTLPINTSDFSKQELLECVKTFVNGKKAGLDNIPVEVWETEVLTEPLLAVCNKTLHGDKADIWAKRGLVPLPKKGSLDQANHYRGISLTVIAAKIYNKMLLCRIWPHIEPILQNNQNGFRPKRSTVAQILSLRRLIEGIKAKHLSAVLTFIEGGSCKFFWHMAYLTA